MSRLATRALKHRNFRLFVIGQSVSLMGTWMQQVAMGWLVYRLTRSPSMLGAVGFFTQIPTFFLAPFAGVMVDRWMRRRMVLVTQTFAMLQAFVLAFLVASHQVTVPWVLFLSAVLGVSNAFDVPARQSFLIEMIDKKEDLGNAIALNSSMFNAARLIGPSIAGVIIATRGEAVCFFVNGVSYLAVIAAISAMKIKQTRRISLERDILQKLKDGFSYAFGFPPIRSILLLLALVSFMGAPYTVLMPVFAKEILGGDAQTLGFLVGATGLGALAGAVYLASRENVRGLLVRIAVSAGLFGMGLVMFSRSHSLIPSIIFLVVIGFGMMTQTVASNTILQTVVQDDKRGRVMSFFTMSLMGMAPLGNLAAGVMAEHLGAPATLLLGGAACILAAIFFTTQLPSLRKILRGQYQEMGILPAPSAKT